MKRRGFLAMSSLGGAAALVSRPAQSASPPVRLFYGGLGDAALLSAERTSEWIARHRWQDATHLPPGNPEFVTRGVRLTVSGVALPGARPLRVEFLAPTPRTHEPPKFLACCNDASGLSLGAPVSFELPLNERGALVLQAARSIQDAPVTFELAAGTPGSQPRLHPGLYALGTDPHSPDALVSIGFPPLHC